MLYPFTFKPILKKVIWGGSDICPFKGITPVENGVGESWELSHVEEIILLSIMASWKASLWMS